MSLSLKHLREYANGKINESTLATMASDTDIFDLENDEEFMQECAAIALPVIVQTELLGETAERIDEDTAECVARLSNYFVGQGLISEAAAVSISNPKVNYVRLNKESQINRLATIFTLKMARRDNRKSYKKYKLGQKIKKANMADMTKTYGAKAMILAKKYWAKFHKGNKLKSVTAEKKRT